jgi:hypothetical protein
MLAYNLSSGLFFLLAVEDYSNLGIKEGYK